MMGKADTDVVEHMIVGVRFHRNGTAEIFVFRTEPHRNHRKNQHWKIIFPFFLQGFLYLLRHSLGYDIVRPQRGLAAVLLQRAQRNQDYRFFLIYLFHFPSCQIPVIAYHRLHHLRNNFSSQQTAVQ